MIVIDSSESQQLFKAAALHHISSIARRQRQRQSLLCIFHFSLWFILSISEFPTLFSHIYGWTCERFLSNLKSKEGQSDREQIVQLSCQFKHLPSMKFVSAFIVRKLLTLVYESICKPVKIFCQCTGDFILIIQVRLWQMTNCFAGHPTFRNL
jgi:hypothetical protein